MQNSKKPFRKYSIVIFFLSFALFLFVKLPFVAYKFSDENIYFYIGSMIKDGRLPYRDFPFVNPPLQVYIIAFLMLFTGKNLLLIKLIPFLCVFLTSFLLFKFMRAEKGELEAIATSIFYMFSFVVLTTTDHSTGIHLSTLFITASFYFAWKKMPVKAGVLGSAAMLTRLYSIFPVAGILFFFLFTEAKKKVAPKVSLKFLISSILFVGPVFLFFQIISNGALLEQVFLFRMGLVPFEGIPKLRIISFFLRWDALLVFFSIVFIFSKEKKKFELPLFICLFLFIFYLVYADMYYLYLGLIIPFLSIFSANGMSTTVKKFRYGKQVAVFILIFLVAFNSFFYARDHGEASKIEFIYDLVNYIKENSSPGDMLYGSVEITPLVSLLAERKIPEGLEDTNDKLFITGLIDREEATRVVKEKVKFIITKVLLGKGGKIIEMGRFIDPNFLESYCRAEKVYPLENDYSSNAVILWRCKD